MNIHVTILKRARVKHVCLNKSDQISEVIGLLNMEITGNYCGLYIKNAREQHARS
mgnify:FL=1